MTNHSNNSNSPLNILLNKLAIEYLEIETMEIRNSDRLDFYDVSVWSVKSALEAAYYAGKASSTSGARLAD
ncbi:MAG: hypothetical protein KUG74_10815 [Rhodobacteraceae bacterium]|nr:hypothetical protein [Paracoccaceae bacterium]